MGLRPLYIFKIGNFCRRPILTSKDRPRAAGMVTKIFLLAVCATVCGADPTLNRRWFTMSFSLECISPEKHPVDTSVVFVLTVVGSTPCTQDAEK